MLTWLLFCAATMAMATAIVLGDAVILVGMAVLLALLSLAGRHRVTLWDKTPSTVQWVVAATMPRTAGRLDDEAWARDLERAAETRRTR